MLYRGQRYVAVAAPTDVPNFADVWEKWGEQASRYYSEVVPDSDIEERAREMASHDDDPDATWEDFYEDAAIELADEYAETRLLGRLDDVIDEIDALPKQLVLYRAVSLPPETDPAMLDHLGTYWSLDRDAAQPYMGRGKEDARMVRYRAEVSSEYIDLYETILNRAHPVSGEYEHEIALRRDAPVFVVDAELFTDTWGHQAEGSISINAQRRT